MEEQAEKMNKILSAIYLGFDVLYFLFIIKSICKSSKKLTKSLKKRLCILCIIDIIIYFLFLFDSTIFDKLYYELYIVAIYAFQIYLFISIYYGLIDLIILKKLEDYKKTIHSYQIGLISFLLVFPFHRLLNFDPKITIAVQNTLVLFFIYIFYKTLADSIISILKILSKQFVGEIQILKNLKLLLIISLIFISGKIIINIILILFVDPETQDFLYMPLNLINYLKFMDYTFFYLLFNQIDEIQIEKTNNDDTSNTLRQNNELN